jgi:hypothetical protein
MASKLVRKYRKNKTSKRNNFKRERSSRRSRVNHMRGGDDGRYVLPPSYFGRGACGYVENPSAGQKLAVSQGIIHADGKFAGPNLYPGQVGAGCGCNGRKQKNKNSKSSKSSKKSKTLKRTKKH